MPVFKNYDRDGKLLEQYSEPLNEKNLDRFIAEYGVERAEMYFQALEEFTAQLQKIVFRPSINGGLALNSFTKASRSSEKLYRTNKEFLDKVKQHGYSISSDFKNDDASLTP